MSKKILIVEDTPDISDALRQLIELHGHTAIVARGGFEALRKVKNEKPDLILLDLAMPDLNGEEVARQIRSDPAFAAIPILCVSSYTDGRREELLAAGFDEVFSKSSFILSLAPTLDRYLKR